MIRGLRILLAAVVITLLPTATNPAHNRIDPGVSLLYQLGEGSAYTSGCFGPCVCPAISAAMRGTFLLTAAGSDALFATYQIDEVRWSVALGDPDLHITGSGTYRIGGEFASQQQLSLELQIGDQPVQRYDSGLVAVSVPFPGISVTISTNGQACFDTALGIQAVPVPSREIRPGGTALRNTR